MSDSKILIPAGRYYLGDPCYAVPEEDWGELLKSCEFFNQPVGEVRGCRVVAFPTLYGDGEYPCNFEDKLFPVDSGLIGLTPADYAVKEPFGSLLVEFDTDVFAYADPLDPGWLVFGPFVVYTGSTEDPFEDEEDDDEEEF